MDPGEQRRVVGRVPLAGGEHAGGPGQVPVDTIVNGVDPRHDRPRLLVRAEAELQHRVDRVIEAPRPAAALRAERAVVGYPLGHERVRELQQDGRAPREEEDDLPLELPADALVDGHGGGSGSQGDAIHCETSVPRPGAGRTRVDRCRTDASTIRRVDPQLPPFLPSCPKQARD